MPYVRATDGTRVHYRIVGDRHGPPLLMVQGLGADSRGWMFQRFAFGARYRCILMDNRGVGHSDAPPGPYDLEEMATDAVAVLDHAGFDSAHVIGASMGGIIAQVLGVRHADRVRSLTLACTGCRHLPWRRQLLSEWSAVGLREGMGALSSRAAKWLVGPRSMRRFWPAFGLFGSRALDVEPESFAAQVDAILSLDDALRFELGTVRVPTLCLVGSQDILTPVGDSHEIASLVPGAELAIVPGGAHGFMVEHARRFNRLALDFLDRASSIGPSTTRRAAVF